MLALRGETPPEVAGSAPKRFARRLFAQATLAGRYRRVETLPDSPRAIIVCAGGNMGGTIISLPLISGFRERFPNAHLAVVCNRAIGADVVRHAGVADSVHVLDAQSRTKANGQIQFSQTMRSLKQLRADLLVTNCDANGIERFLMPLRVPYRIGHTCSLEGRPLAWSTSNLPVPLHGDNNWLDAYGALLQAAGAAPIRHPRITPLPPDEGDSLLRQCGWTGGSLVGLQADVWHGQQWKQWPLERLFSIARELWTRRQIQPVLFAAQPMTFAGQLPADVPFVNATGRTPLARLTSALSRCSLAITNDSGLMHLAAAMDVPTVAIYGMTDPRKTWCYGERGRHRIVRRTDCLPCFSMAAGLPEGCSHRKCLTELTESAVYSAAESLLDGSETRSLQEFN